MVLLTLIIGLITSYLGSITPSMLNITAIKLRLENGKKNAIQFAFGVAFIVIFQAYIGLYILTILNQYPSILDQLQIVIVIVFAALSIFFYLKSRKDRQEDLAIDTPKKIKNGFLIGVSLSSINMFAIPFFCGVGAMLNLYDWFLLEPLSMLAFSLGSSIGAFFILYHYILLAEKIRPRLQSYTQHFNMALAVLTGFLALFTFFKLL